MRIVALVGVWLLATAAAIAVATAGVNIVSNKVIEPAPARATASVISQPAQPARDRPTPTPPPSTEPAPSTTATMTTVTTTSTSTPLTATSTTLAPAAPTTAAPPPPTATTPAPPPPTTSAAPATILTFHMVGGSTAISFSPDAVTVVWATANPGFEVERDDKGDSTRVEFRSETQRSRVDASWDDGPDHEIREEPDDG